MREDMSEQLILTEDRDPYHSEHENESLSELFVH